MKKKKWRRENVNDTSAVFTLKKKKHYDDHRAWFFRKASCRRHRQSIVGRHRERWLIENQKMNVG